MLNLKLVLIRSLPGQVVMRIFSISILSPLSYLESYQIVLRLASRFKSNHIPYFLDFVDIESCWVILNIESYRVILGLIELHLHM